jgi:DNA primase
MRHSGRDGDEFRRRLADSRAKADLSLMALPPGFLDEIRNRLPISEVVGPRVTWDSRKSNPAKGDFWACCPFHEEKSPSFHVDDRKGFYHCFGCHAKGDHIAFLRERENMSFMEAVETLARAAGLEMPARDPAAAARAEKASGLAQWMEAAEKFYRAQLRGARGRAALDYLRGRGLSEETMSTFGLGYAPAERRALFEHLTGKGADAAQLIEAGLVARPEDGGAPYDRFRDRVIFPIRDPRGRCIAFGGRAMSADARAKYLNSPETPLFDKSRTLYNHGPARAAAAKAGALVAVEGYMDVIALAQAGIAHAVAPLGTAVTEHHLRMLWRIAPEPVIALDGDKAGRAAALRVADLALPMLEAGKSLRFALMPPGLDPDDLVRAQGPEAARAAFEAAEPVIALLWRRETEGRSFDSPERRAALDARLRALVGQVGDPTVRRHYGEAFAALRRDLFGGGRRADRGADRGAPQRRHPGRPGGRFPPGRGWMRAEDLSPTPETRASALARAPEPTRAREATILLTLLNHPALLESHAEAVDACAFLCPDLDALRGAFLSASAEAGSPTDAAPNLRSALGGSAVRRIEAVASALSFTRPDAAPEAAQRGLEEALARQSAEVALRAEVAEAAEALAGPEAGREVDGRLSAAALAAQRGLVGRMPEDGGDDDAVAQALRDAIAAEIWVKKRRKREPNR